MKAYDTYIKKWNDFTKSNNIQEPSISNVANFLSKLFKDGASYSTVNLASSAVSAYINPESEHKIGRHPVICRLMKGVFEQRPALPKYTETWDVDSVVESLEQWSATEKLSLKQLTLRTVMLLALLSGQRGQTIHKLTVGDISLYQDKCVLVFSSVLKHTRPGVHQKPLELQAFPNKNLCIVAHLSRYLELTKDLRSGKELFISYVKPHAAVTRNTISRWIKEVLNIAGIDTKKYSAHSTRAASTSAAFSRDVPLSTILQAAGWSRIQTFSKFYCRPVTGKQTATHSLGVSVLDKSLQGKT